MFADETVNEGDTVTNSSVGDVPALFVPLVAYVLRTDLALAVGLVQVKRNGVT